MANLFEIHSMHLARSPGGEREARLVERTREFSTCVTLYLTGLGIIIVYHRVSSSFDAPLRSRTPTCTDVHHVLQFHYFSLVPIVKREREKERKGEKKREREYFIRSSSSAMRLKLLALLLPWHKRALVRGRLQRKY